MAAAIAPPDPITFDDPTIPPINGYVPYGKWTKSGEWKVTRPCQPSIIPMIAPNGQTFLAYEHPPGQHVKGKNNSESVLDAVTGRVSAISGQVGRVGRAVGNAITVFLH